MPETALDGKVRKQAGRKGMRGLGRVAVAAVEMVATAVAVGVVVGMLVNVGNRTPRQCVKEAVMEA